MKNLTQNNTTSSIKSRKCIPTSKDGDLSRKTDSDISYSCTYMFNRSKRKWLANSDTKR